jgi:hypothetical protein
MKGNAHGPRDGRGYQGGGPKDGTFYGAPAEIIGLTNPV